MDLCAPEWMVVRMEDGSDELPFEPKEIHVVEAWD
jgi:hypothetical protein